MPTTTRPKAGAAKPPADEAQAEPIEGEVVDPPKTDGTQSRLDVLREVVVQRIRAEVNPKFAAMRSELDGLAETLAAVQETDGSAQTLEEDALSDRIDAAVESAIRKLTGDETAPGDYATLRQRMDDQAQALVKHQTDIHQALGELAANFGSALKDVNDTVQELRLRDASATGVLRDVVAEQRAAVPGVYRKVHQLMLEVTEIGKGREFKAETKGASGRIEYTFRGIDDAMDAVGAALRSVGLIMRSEVVKAESTVHEVPRFWQGKQEGVTLWATTRLTMRYTFIDPDDGSEHSVEGYGVGKDNGDKDGSKSSAAAMKYALFQGLCIPVKGMNIDPEEEHPTGEPTPQQRQARAEEGEHDEQAPPPDDTPAPDPEHALRRATGALAAARNPEKTRTQADVHAILVQAAREKILSTEVEGQTLQAWLIGIRRTLGTGGQDG